MYIMYDLMELKEQFVQGKKINQELCEDGIFKSDWIIAVIDGATAKSPICYDGKSSGRAALEKIKESIAINVNWYYSHFYAL